MTWYQYTKSQLEQEFKVTVEQGLSQTEAQNRILTYGPNTLAGKQPDSWAVIFFRQFKSPLIYVLLACAATIYYLGDITDAAIILVVLIFNAVLGTVQEGRSARTLESLKKLSAVYATVLRDGKELIVPESEVVPGDVLMLIEGQRVVADARVVLSVSLSVDEAPLTGESGGVLKHERSLEEEGLQASRQHNMVFKGTSILAGSGQAVVVGTGMQTEIGKISSALLAPEEEIPLQKNIRKLSQVIIIAIVIISVLLFFFGIAVGKPPREMFAVVVSLAVSLIPEGLPLVLTLILVTGVWRMSKRNALVKKMQAVEALGQADVLCVDKTGTITKNEMVVEKLYMHGSMYIVTGSGYEPKGVVTLAGAESKTEDVMFAAKLAGLASKAKVQMDEAEGVYRVAGDPTEAAMGVFGEKLGFARDTLLKHYHEVGELPFDYKTKYHAVFVKEESGDILCAAAGAPEIILEHSEFYLKDGKQEKLDAPARQVILAAQEEFATEGLRVVAFGFKHEKEDVQLDNIKKLVFAGLFGITDAVRPEAKDAILKAHIAGLKVVMITGDHTITAKAIAKQAGIFVEGDDSISGKEITELPEEELLARLPKTSVFSRVTPQDKMKLIQLYKKQGLMVAMTGDGVNDAPPLVAADLGVAMGRIGTEVAKEAADIILLDDNLGSIVAAIEEGRAMYKNIQKAIWFLFSTSLGELFAITFALFLGIPIPILAVQILWLNLITDPLMGLALAVTKKEPGLLERQKVKLPKYFLDKHLTINMFLAGLIMAIGTLFVFWLYVDVNETLAFTMSLTTLAVFQWFNGINSVFLEESALGARLFLQPAMWAAILANLGLQLFAVYFPPLQRILKTTALTWAQWSFVVLIAITVVVVMEGWKRIRR